MEAKGLEGLSNAAFSKAWWGKLWSLKLPSMVKIFLWQAFRGVLPYFPILNRRGVKCLNGCTRCCRRVESVWHSLWECPSAREVHIGKEEASIGAIIRDSEGMVVAGFARCVTGFFLPHITVCLALREDLSFAHDLGLQIEIAKTDAVRLASERSKWSGSHPCYLNT
ncbi:hypothetical protein TIFTF001_033144 [Ficus carica]|uniref:Reverse transcriptase zinc-binding domain-containing protein n=1 Tax=Ficus carica TaxID=3494 RepID=A0AA88J7B0_FICCA|nr:hypothetical protein TIFTF001_033144 [Ficus carica]